MNHQLVTTTFDLPGYRVAQGLGVVRGIIVRSRSVVGNFFAGFQMFLGFVGSYRFEPLFVRLAKVDARVFNRRKNHECRCLKMASEQAGGSVLIDDGGHAANAAKLIDGNRNSSSAATNDDLPGVH